MNAFGVFVAVLLHEDSNRDYAVELPRNENLPPRRILIPTDFLGAAAFDAYDLIDASEWPSQAVFCHVEVIPRTVQEVAVTRAHRK
ncbi:hypothetical protein [Leifsonia sp. SIMBA_070]|uniref:hypothetical protein n=1 Tax=Leifsonia sp. SIMBA_070 TaxID=3085810 RepID=UPI00397D04C3